MEALTTDAVMKWRYGDKEVKWGCLHAPVAS
jgi:hypothetical protein